MSHIAEPRSSVLRDLSAKFCNNLNTALTQSESLAQAAEMQARAVPVVAAILGRQAAVTTHQQQALCMFDEIFADLVCSIYLSACGLDKPAQMSLRRALELGAATVYLWDLPHVFWAWKDHDKDLNFNDMLEHFSSPGFQSFVRNENPRYQGPDIIDGAKSRTLYRILSNIVHGKIKTFESTLPDRFQHSEVDWRSHLESVCQVEEVLLDLWRNRFRSVAEQLLEDFPQLRMQRKEVNGTKT